MYWRPSHNFPLTTESPLEPLLNLSSPILRDIVRNNCEDEPVMVEKDLGYRCRAIKFILGQSWYNRGYFHDALKEFVIVNNFEFEYM